MKVWESSYDNVNYASVKCEGGKKVKNLFDELPNNLGRNRVKKMKLFLYERKNTFKKGRKNLASFLKLNRQNGHKEEGKKERNPGQQRLKFFKHFIRSQNVTWVPLQKKSDTFNERRSTNDKNWEAEGREKKGNLGAKAKKSLKSTIFSKRSKVSTRENSSRKKVPKAIRRFWTRNSFPGWLNIRRRRRFGFGSCWWWHILKSAGCKKTRKAKAQISNYHTKQSCKSVQLEIGIMSVCPFCHSIIRL